MQINDSHQRINSEYESNIESGWRLVHSCTVWQWTEYPTVVPTCCLQWHRTSQYHIALTQINQHDYLDWLGNKLNFKYYEDWYDIAVSDADIPIQVFLTDETTATNDKDIPYHK